MINKKLYFITTLAILILFTSSCRQSLFLQRKYTKGVYSEHSSAPKVLAAHCQKKNTPETALRPAYKEKVLLNHVAEKLTPTEVASICKKAMAMAKQHPAISTNDCGDKIILKNGKTLVCKVYEISEEEIKYKLCDQLYGIYYYAKVEDAYKILFANGTQEIFNTKKASPQTIAKVEAPKNKLVGFALFGYFASAIFLVLLGAGLAIFPIAFIGILLFILGLSLALTDKNTKNKTGIDILAGFGTFLGVLCIALGILIVFVLILFASLL